MPINWAQIAAITARSVAHSQLMKIITPSNYGWGPNEWNLSEVVQTTDSRKFMVYQLLEGTQPDGRKHPGMELKAPGGAGPFLFKFQVLTRQACCRDKDGNKFWTYPEALETYGDDGDICPAFDDVPQPGDVVEIKGYRKTWDAENDRPVDTKVLRQWAFQGTRPESYVEFEVDEEGCIHVPYPFALSMLSNHGEKIAFPMFQKPGKGQKRKLTNWWFREVHPQEPVKPLKKKGK